MSGWVALDPQGLEAVGSGLLWVSLVASSGWAAGVVLQGARDAKAHWDSIEAKRRRLEYLREAARDERLGTEVSETWQGPASGTSNWNKGSDWND